MLIKFFLSKKFENKKIIKDKNKKIIKIFKKVLNEKSEILKSLGKNYSYNFTKKQLANWNLNYHKLIFGKPSYDIFIDDKNYNFDNSWLVNLQKKLKL